MSSRQTSLPSSPALKKDRDSLLALKDYPEYAPPDPAISTELLFGKQAAYDQASAEAARLLRAYEAARLAEIHAAWDFHDSMVRARAAVVVQFGADSHAVRAIGYKRKSERKRPVRRPAASAQ